MSVFVGRDAKLFKGGTAIAYAKSISVKATASVIEEHTMDDAEPEICEPGNLTYEWSCERLFTDETYTAAILAGTDNLEIIFGPGGVKTAGTKLTGAYVTSIDENAGMDGGVIERITGKAAAMSKLPV